MGLGLSGRRAREDGRGVRCCVPETSGCQTDAGPGRCSLCRAQESAFASTSLGVGSCDARTVGQRCCWQSRSRSRNQGGALPPWALSWCVVVLPRGHVASPARGSQLPLTPPLSPTSSSSCILSLKNLKLHYRSNHERRRTPAPPPRPCSCSKGGMGRRGRPALAAVRLEATSRWLAEDAEDPAGQEARAEAARRGDRPGVP